MICLRFTADDLSRIRFASSPLWEAVMSLRVLTSPDGAAHLHRPWRQDVVHRLAGIDMTLLTTLVRPAGYIPDFLVPSPHRRTIAFDTALRQVALADPAEVAAQLAHLAHHPIARESARRAERARLLRSLAGAPGDALAVIVRELERYWRAAVAPYWSRVQALLQADIAHRLEEFADGGVAQLFRTLHPLISFDRDRLRVVKYYEGNADLAGRGLLLIPCAFAWPDVIVLTAQPHVPTLSYSPRGIGGLWQTRGTRGSSALANILGRTRAALLAQLDLPMSTTQIAAHMALSAPTVNVHVRALRGAGILASHRAGRQVLYARTQLGEQLLTATAGAGTDT